MAKSTWIALQSVLAFVTAVSCFGGSSHDNGGNCAEGSEGCACYGNATCDADLSCLSNLCVNAASGGSAGSSASSGGSAGSSVGQAGDDTSGGSNGSGGSSGGTAGTSANAGSGGQSSGACDTPLVWLVVATSGGMFDSTLDGASAFPQIVDALVGDAGVLKQLDGQLRFGLTLFNGPTDSCPAFTTVEPAAGNLTDIENALESVAQVPSDTPAPAAYAEALDQLNQVTTDGPRYLLVIHHSTPDFCDDGDPMCPRDKMISAAQGALAEHNVRTLVAGVELPTGDLKGQDYFQALALAGQGFAVEPLVDNLTLEAVCQAPYGTYGTGTTGTAEFAYGDNSTTDFAAQLSALLSSVDSTCP